MINVPPIPYDLQALGLAYQEMSDLDFELKVHEHLKSVGWQSDHGGRYLDHITQKMREYDILGTPPGKTFDGGTANAGFYKMEAVIECKNLSPDAPLVIGVRPYENETVLALRLLRDHRVEVTGYHIAINIARMHAFVAAFGQDFIEHIGVEVSQIPVSPKGPRPDKNILYDKWSQAVSHAVVRYSAMISEIARGSTNGDMPIWCPAVLVVPDDRLFIAVRGKAGVTLKKTLGTSVKVGYEFDTPMLVGQRACISNYFVFTYTGLQRFASMFK